MFHCIVTDLYGMWGAFSTKEVMTRPRVRRDILMFPASRARLSTAPDLPMFSDPAKSTRCNLPVWKGQINHTEKCFCLAASNSLTMYSNNGHVYT